MDDLLREFLTETGEHLDTVDVELVRLEQTPDDHAILRNVFRLVHTIKGTCGFLGLPRLESLSHAAETLLGQLRDGMPVTADAVTLILAAVDRVKLILAELDRTAAEPPGNDDDLIARLRTASATTDDGSAFDATTPSDAADAGRRLGAVQASIHELERAFHETPGPASEVPGPKSPRDIPGGDEPQRDGAAPDPERARHHTIRVGVETLEHLMTMVSELVLTRNQLLELARRHDQEGDLKASLQRLSHVTAELQEGVMKTRMQPIGSAWAKLPRVLRDLGPELGKQIEIEMSGAETELDRQVLELIRDPLTHMVRNSADHGIETPAERRALGKPEHGTIRLNAFHEGGSITIEIADDGCGLDYAAIRRRAAALGLAQGADLARMSDEQVGEFIFHPGLSTSRAVTSVSGRGVGMDVVRTNINLIGGTIEVSSERGRGSVFAIKIPLTLAIVAALIVKVGGQRFALPQVSAVELVRVGKDLDHAIDRLNGCPVLSLRGQLLPVIDVASLLGVAAERATPDDGFVIVAQIGRQRFGMLVDGVLETEEIVVKPMSAKLKSLQLFSGNTILGDGTVVLILEPNGMARRIGSELLRGLTDNVAAAEPEPADETETLTLLVFRAHDASYKALPLSLVTRLEEVDATQIERAGPRCTLQYRGRLMPIVPIEGGSVRTDGHQPIIVVSDGERSMGLAVSEIVDVVDEAAIVERQSDRRDLVGSAVVRGRATEIVDLTDYLPRAYADWGRARPAQPGGTARRNLLLVDDKPFFRDLLTPVLRAAGYHVLTAGAADAMAALRAGPVEVLVCDLDMPVRSGLDLISDLRREPAFAALKVVALSSEASREVLDAARRLHVHDVVAKFDRSGLVAALAETDLPLGAVA